LEEGQIKTVWESVSLDATTFVHNGTRYLSWAQHDPKLGGNTGLYIAKMKSPTEIVGPMVRISYPDLPWETVGFKVNEGPAFLARGDKVFLAYSAAKTDANYCVGLLTASADADLLDPKSWQKSPVPVFKSDEEAKVFGPGHNCFTKTPDGKHDVFVYHARDYKEIKGDPLNDVNRHTRAQILNWTPDGRPDFGQAK
jgi:GH43 family beta-xylosidase